MKAQIYDDLEELRVDPMNKRGDWRSSIRQYKDPRAFTYSLVVAEGRFLIVYSVLQDYPKVWLRALVDPGTDDIRG